MKFLGIDYGTKRIGVALSDEDGILAFPKEIVLNDANTFKKIGNILKEENISEIIIGESVDFSGRLNALSIRIEEFISELKIKFEIPIHKQKEFLTSVEARRLKDSFSTHFPKRVLSPSQAHSRLKDKKRGRIDASAAALILQRYLDKKNNKNNK